MSSQPPKEVFDPDDLIQLQENGHITSEQNGFYILPDRRVLEHFISPIDPIESTEVLVYLHSQQTYQYLGFTPSTASHLFQVFTDLRLDPDLHQFSSFPQIALDYILFNTGGVIVPQDHAWDTKLTELGVSEELRMAIMRPDEPEFERLRFTMELGDWVKMAVEMRWRGLVGIQTGSRRRGEGIRAARGEGGGGDGGGGE